MYNASFSLVRHPCALVRAGAGLWLSGDDVAAEGSGAYFGGWLMSSSKIDAVMFFALHFYVYWEVSPSKWAMRVWHVPPCDSCSVFPYDK